jgi:hypothetical protein
VEVYLHLQRAQPKFAEGNDFVCAVPFCLLFVRQKVRIETKANKLATKD